jgi:predicted regulator of Ras-like GTPase activity (Roadblock/LC7/MglB family)
MGFRETLEQICKQVEGSLAASVMGYDGIAVETIEVDLSKVAAPPDVDLQSAMIEYSNVFGQIRTAAEQLQAGEASEFSIRTEKILAVGRSVGPEHFVVLTLTPAGNLGKARYALRVGAGRIAAEL